MDYTYDSLGRMEKTTDQNSRDVQYQYDTLGRRTRLTWPDGSYDYLWL
jgi:YD repeat-containing protein